MNDERTENRRTLPALVATGFFILLPVLLLVLVLERLFVTLQEKLEPLLGAFPGTVFRNPTVRFGVALLLLLLLLALIGWVAGTRPGQAAGRWLDRRVLGRLPLYALLRSLAAALTGSRSQESLKAVAVTVDIPGLQQLGVIIEKHADGSATVFLPSTPAVGSGTVVVVEASRLRELDVPARKVFGALARWGHGTGALLAAPGLPACMDRAPQERAEDGSRGTNASS